MPPARSPRSTRCTGGRSRRPISSPLGGASGPTCPSSAPGRRSRWVGEGGTAFSPCRPAQTAHVVLAIPHDRVSTAAAYRDASAALTLPARPCVLDELRNGGWDALAALQHNDFERSGLRAGAGVGGGPACAREGGGDDCTPYRKRGCGRRGVQSRRRRQEGRRGGGGRWMGWPLRWWSRRWRQRPCRSRVSGPPAEAIRRAGGASSAQRTDSATIRALGWPVVQWQDHRSLEPVVVVRLHPGQ